MVKELSDYCYGFLYTIVDKEGMLGGTDLEAYRQIGTMTSNKIIAAGGITTMDEIKALENLDVDSQLGMCIYTGKVKLDEAFANLINFDKGNGLVPTIVPGYNNKTGLNACLFK